MALLAGEWLKVRRAENLAHTIKKAKERLKESGVEPSEPASLSLALPIFEAAADESRDELQDLWARLLAATVDPSKASHIRIRFIEAAEKMDPLDASVLNGVQQRQGSVTGTHMNELASELGVSRDQLEVSCDNLKKLELLTGGNSDTAYVTSFGREFLRAISD